MLVILAGLALLWLAYSLADHENVETATKIPEPVPEPVPEIPPPPKPWATHRHNKRS